MLIVLSASATEKPVFGKLFLTPSQRQAVDQQRAAYFGHVTPDRSSPVLAAAKPKNQKKKTARLAPKLSLSSIITTTDGQLVRLNGKYVKQSRLGYKVESIQNSNVAKVSIRGKAISLQVGETYVPAKKKALKTYVIEPNQGAKVKQEKLKGLPTNVSTHSRGQDKTVQNMNAQLVKLKKLTELMGQ